MSHQSSLSTKADGSKALESTRDESAAAPFPYAQTVEKRAQEMDGLVPLMFAAGAQVSTAQSVEEALRHLDAEPPSVLVSDLGMPQVDGFALIEQVRRHRNPIVRRMPAAALTA